MQEIAGTRDVRVQDAQALAARVCLTGGLTMVDRLDDAGLRQVQQIVDEVWAATDGSLVSAEILHALTHSGNHVLLAMAEGRPVGAAIAMLGHDRDGFYLHSHMAGVLPAAQTRHVGYAMKLHQRAWALQRDIAVISWTYDPLVRRNAYFNLVKLGADAVSFHENFYGSMTDGVNAGEESDRMLVAWPLARSVSHGSPAGPTRVDLLAMSARPVLAVGSDGGPRMAEPAGAVVTCDVPSDIAGLRTSDRSLAATWRQAFRAALWTALQSGYRVAAFSRAHGYVLVRDEAPTAALSHWPA